MRIELGVTRRVFIFNKFVVKIPSTKEYKLFLNGILANLQEKQRSGQHPDLASVLWCDPLGLFLFMEKADAVGYPGWFEDEMWGPFQEMLAEKYKDDDLKEFLLSDPKPSNWGYIGDKLVKIDYGN
jgi:hypothetical protein